LGGVNRNAVGECAGGIERIGHYQSPQGLDNGVAKLADNPASKSVAAGEYVFSRAIVAFEDTNGKDARLLFAVRNIIAQV
jgi:hypothetical protein